MTLTNHADGTTTLDGEVVDQAALHGLLPVRTRLGLPLLSVTRLDLSRPPHARSNHEDHAAPSTTTRTGRQPAMTRLTSAVLRHRRPGERLWLGLFVAGLLGSGQLGHRWAYDFSLPGQPGDTAEHQLFAAYGVSSQNAFVAVVTCPRPDRRGRRESRPRGDRDRCGGGSFGTPPAGRSRQHR